MSTLHTNTVETSSGGPVALTQQAAAKMYINFNGTGTVANFLNINYVMNYGQKNETSGRIHVNAGGLNQADPTTSRSEIMAYREHPSLAGSFDPQFVYVTGYGDLA
jgi:hypothetical protein